MTKYITGAVIIVFLLFVTPVQAAKSEAEIKQEIFQKILVIQIGLQTNTLTREDARIQILEVVTILQQLILNNKTDTIEPVKTIDVNKESYTEKMKSLIKERDSISDILEDITELREEGKSTKKYCIDSLTRYYGEKRCVDLIEDLKDKLDDVKQDIEDLKLEYGV